MSFVSGKDTFPKSFPCQASQNAFENKTPLFTHRVETVMLIGMVVLVG